MLSDINLQRLVRSAENLAEREVESGAPKKRAPLSLDKVLAAPIVAYLLEPYESGYWELKAEWNVTSPLAKYLLNKLDTTAEFEKESEASGLPPTAARRLSDEKRTELLRITNRISAVNELFRAAIVNEDGESVPKVHEIYSWISKIDLADLRATFADAYAIFSQHIYFDGFAAGFSPSRPYRIKDGLLSLLSAPRDSGSIHIVAMSRAELSTLRDFYLALGVITTNTFQRIFAPDEALFRPYFTLVSSVLNHVIQDSQISRVFAQALAYYEEEDFQHCISSLGLIAEDYIQRVYTTLLREPLPGNHTLGQILERLGRRIDDYLPLPKPSLRSVDSAYDLIKALPATSDSTALSQALRELIHIIQDDRQYFGKRIDELAKPVNRRTVFPPTVSDTLNELLKWRNAASHNSRIPLGAHEADRTLFCLITLINWWQKQLATLDWTKSRVEIIDVLIAATRS
ncbi:MAG: hypothetical protein ACM3SV_11065 [Betaproteobacteria bacterium]